MPIIYDIFWHEAILLLRRELGNKQKTIDKLFNILRNNNTEITKHFFFNKNFAEKKLSENVIPNNSEIQFVITKLLNYCFEEAIRFDVKASFSSCPLSSLIRSYNKPGDITK